MAKTKTKLSNDYIFDWESYGQAVLSGLIPVSQWTLFGVKRHYDDLQTGHLRGLCFSEIHAQHALETFLFLKHSKGEFAGKDFLPEPWQVFWTAVLFGWLKEDGTRRFKECWLEVPRKNGKTTWLVAILMHLFYFDGEGGAEVYTAATKMDQAKISHSEAVRMVQNSPWLKRHIGIRRDELFNPIPGRADKFVPLGRDSKSLDGLNPSAAGVDEVHAHPSSQIYDVIKSGMGARVQPMIVQTTTAGFDLSSFGYQQHGYAKKVLSGDFGTDADDFLSIIYTVDNADDWTNPVEWQKANPNWGITVFEKRMALDCAKAIRQATEEPNFKTKHLNIWLASGTQWIRREDWLACADKTLKLDDFVDEKCWLGLDLAEKSDLAAVCLIFKRGKKYYIFFKFYLNEYQAHMVGQEYFYKWERQGELIVTAGNSTDFDVIADDLRRFAKQFNMQEIAYDPKFAAYFAAKLLEEGMPLVEITQTASHYTLPIVETENMVLTRDLVHEGKEAMEWQMQNVVIQESRYSGLRKPTKEKSELKIDGPVAMMMAMGRALGGRVQETSFWESA